MGSTEPPAAPDPAAAAERRRARGWCAATVVAVASVVLYRRPDEFLSPQLCSEDGPIFFKAAMEEGAASMFRPYAQYLHLFPRLVAWGATFLPVRWAPGIYAWASLAAVLGVCAYLFRTRAAVPRPALLGLCVALVPNGVFLFGNLAHVQWFLALLFPVLAIQREPRDAPGAAADLALLAFLGLTGPFAILALPLFAVRWVKVRGAHPLRMLVLCAACAVVQAAVLLAHRGEGPDTGHSAYYWTRALSIRIGGELLLGERLAWTTPTAVLVALTVGLAAGLAYLVRRLPEGRRLGAAMAAFSAAVLASMVVKSLSHPLAPHLWGHCTRYFFIPLVAALWTAVAALEESGARRSAAAAFLLLSLVLSTTSGGFRWVRRDHFQWEPLWEPLAARIERGERVHVPIPNEWDFDVQRGQPTPLPASLSPGGAGPSER